MRNRPPKTPSRHDRLFKKVFSNPANVASELACVLPKEMLELLDLTTLKQASSEFVSKDLEANPADLFFSAKMRGIPDQDALLCVLLEHYSQFPRLWQVRVLYYKAHGWMKFCGQNPDAKYLPVIIPVVVYNGKWTYKGPLNFSSLFHPEAVKKYKRVIPDFTPVLEALRTVDSEQLRVRPMDAEAKLGMWFLQHGYTGQKLYEQLDAWKPVLEKLCKKANGGDALESLMRYYMDTPNGPDYAQLLERMEEMLGEKGETNMMTIAEQLRAEGKAQAEANMRAMAEQLRIEGEARGKAEGKASTLLTFLEAREVPILASERERILGCRDLPTLEQWVRRAATAQTAEQIFAHS